MSAVTKAIMVDAMESEDFTLGIAKDADPELRFWRKRALGLAKTCAQLERELRELRRELQELQETVDEISDDLAAHS